MSVIPHPHPASHLTSQEDGLGALGVVPISLLGVLCEALGAPSLNTAWEHCSHPCCHCRLVEVGRIGCGVAGGEPWKKCEHLQRTDNRAGSRRLKADCV